MSLPPKFIHVPTSAGLTIRLNLKNYQQATTSDPPTLPTRSSFPTASSSAPAPLGKYPAKSHCLRVVATLHPELRNATYPPPGRGLIYLPGQPTIMIEDSDFPIKFRQRRYFYYLSGVTDIPDCHLTYDIQRDRLVLYIPPLDPSKVLWSGMPLGKEECKAKYDVDEVRFADELVGDLQGWVRNVQRGNDGGGEVGKMYILNSEQFPLGVDLHPQHHCPKKSPIILDTTALKRSINNCRAIKDTHEVSLIRHAIHITSLAHSAVLNRLIPPPSSRRAPPKNESDLEATFLSICTSNQAKSQAYDPIVCSGRNCATLHYTNNNAPLANKQLVLLDAACEWECYAADITRTIPIGGTFTPEARDIYKLVERMQSETIKKTVAGVPWAETHWLAHRIAIEGLLDLGILRNGTVQEIMKAGTSRAFFPHGLGHMLGLDCHDVEGDPEPHNSPQAQDYPDFALLTEPYPGRQGVVPMTVIARTFREGMVVTVEPGIYFCEWIVRPYLKDAVHGKFIDEKVLEKYWDVGGVRIEDIVLVKGMGRGNEVLSGEVQKVRV